MVAIIKRCYGYWQHLLNTNSQSFTHTALRANINFARRGWDSYYSRIKSLSATLQMKDKIYLVPQKKIKSAAQKFCIKYKELYISNFFNLLHHIALQTESKGKYNIYFQIKKQYHTEIYLYKIRDNNTRKNITGIRCASNILPINALRKLNIKREFRICSLCIEMHVLMDCINDDITKLRSDLFTKIDSLSTTVYLYAARCSNSNSKSNYFIAL